MKRIIIFSLVLSLMAIMACNKNKTYVGGTWTFKNVKYTSTSSHFVRGAFVAYTGTGFPTGSLNFRFFHDGDSTFPQAGIYAATSYPPGTTDTGHVYITLSDTSLSRYYQASNFQNTPITVSRTNGNVTITVPSIELISNQDPTDSATVTGTLYQTP